MNQEFTSFSAFRRRYPIRPNDETMLLGSGSYGKVVKVEDQLETEWVAIKISEVKGADIKSLLEEVKLAQGIPRQANIARYDACYRLETDTSLSDFAVMKYYKDGNLAALLKNEKLSATQIYDLTKGILLGLQHLHKHRIVHRDFKPANILISRDNEGKLIPKIADFGLSKLVGNEEIDNSDFDLSDGRGTPSYKAPEQIEGSRVSFNLDLWAFGVILYEIMVGEKPFQADLRSGSEQAIRRAIELKIVTVDLPSRIEAVPEPYQRIIKRCLVRDIHHRVRKVNELLDLLDNIPQLLAAAQAAELRGDYEEARLGYEQVLRFSSANETAIRGLANCIDKSRPVALTLTDEPTDEYRPATTSLPEELATDVFSAPPISVQTKPAALAKEVRKKPDEKATPVQQRTAQPVTATLPKPGTSLAWRYLVPVAVVVAGLGIYKLSATGTSDSTTQTMAKDSIANPPGTSLTPVPKKTSATVVKRLQVNAPSVVQLVAHMKAQGAGPEARKLLKLWNTAASGTSDVQKKAIQLVQQASKRYHFHDPVPSLPTGTGVPTDPVSTPGTSVSVASTPGTLPVAEKPAPAQPDPQVAKQEAQHDYDQLIEKGAVAISAKNDKAGAIALFTEARQLAEKNDLSTTKGHDKYIQYMGRANRILENDEYEGAKQWFLVAQSLNNTAEVRTKIKFCTNQ